MRLKIFLTSGLWLVLFTQNLAFSAPSINIQTKYYSVFGDNSISIHHSLNKNGPVGENGKRYHAVTKWKVQWSYQWLETGSMCKLTQTEVNLDVEYLLPELKQSNSTSKSFHKNWDKYFQALYKHEQQHKDYGVQAATELDKELLAINREQDCDELENQIAETAQKVLDKYDRIEKEFDRITNHGLNQGVKPP